MNPSISVITLGVDDLKRALAFYQDGLGWETKGIVGEDFENGAVAFFKLPSGLRLALCRVKALLLKWVLMSLKMPMRCC